jgi:hypothetical protein
MKKAEIPFFFGDLAICVLAQKYPGVSREVYEKLHKYQKEEDVCKQLYRIGLKAKSINYPYLIFKKGNLIYERHLSFDEAEEIIDQARARLRRLWYLLDYLKRYPRAEMRLAKMIASYM